MLWCFSVFLFVDPPLVRGSLNPYSSCLNAVSNALSSQSQLDCMHTGYSSEMCLCCLPVEDESNGRHHDNAETQNDDNNTLCIKAWKQTQCH